MTRGSRQPARGSLDVLLVDPSLFTGPYDAALTQGLVEAGVRPVWATRPTRNGDRQEIPPDYVDDFFYRRVDDLQRLPKFLRAVAKGLAHAGGLVRLMQRVRQRRPDVVHFQWIVLPPLDILVIVLLKRWTKVVVTAHDTVPFNGLYVSTLQNHGFDMPLRQADAVVVHTEAGRQRLIGRGIEGRRIVVIPHGPLRIRAETVPAKSPRDPRWTFVMFGEIKPYKGLDILVEAVGQMAPALRSQCRVIVAGREWMDLSPIRKRIAELELGATIDLRATRQTEQEMADLFDATDCFVFPYRQIDASGVFYLTRSLGKWMVASRVGIFAEAIAGGVDGSLVDAESPAQLAEAMMQAIRDRPRPTGAGAGMSWQAIGEATRALYERLLLGSVSVDDMSATAQEKQGAVVRSDNA